MGRAMTTPAAAPRRSSSTLVNDWLMWFLLDDECAVRVPADGDVVSFDCSTRGLHEDGELSCGSVDDVLRRDADVRALRDGARDRVRAAPVEPELLGPHADPHARPGGRQLGADAQLADAVGAHRARGRDGAVEQVRDAEEAGDEAGARPLVEVGGRAELLDLAVVHDRDRVGHRHRLLLVVRDVDEREPELALDALQLELHLLAELQVECAERLVEQQHLRAVHERARERDALLLPAGQLARLALVEPLEPDDAQQLARPSLQLRPSAPSSCAGRTRRSRRRSGAGRAHSSGRPCSPRACRAARPSRACRRPRSSRRPAPRSRRSSAASSSCRSPTARAARRTSPRESRA